MQFQRLSAEEIIHAVQTYADEKKTSDFIQRLNISAHHAFHAYIPSVLRSHELCFDDSSCPPTPFPEEYSISCYFCNSSEFNKWTFVGTSSNGVVCRLLRCLIPAILCEKCYRTQFAKQSSTPICCGCAVFPPPTLDLDDIEPKGQSSPSTKSSKHMENMESMEHTEYTETEEKRSIRLPARSTRPSPSSPSSSSSRTAYSRPILHQDHVGSMESQRFNEREYNIYVKKEGQTTWQRGLITFRPGWLSYYHNREKVDAECDVLDLNVCQLSYERSDSHYPIIRINSSETEFSLFVRFSSDKDTQDFIASCNHFRH